MHLYSFQEVDNVSNSNIEQIGKNFSISEQKLTIRCYVSVGGIFWALHFLSLLPFFACSSSANDKQHRVR